MKSYNKIKLMKMKKLILILAVLINMQANAQDNRSGMLDTHQQAIGIATGIDYSIMPISLNYKRGVKMAKLKYPISVGLETTIPLFDFDLNDIRVKIVTEATLLRKKNFEVRGGINPLIVNLKMQTERMTSLGADFHLFAGITNSKWNIGLTSTYNQVFSTHIKHTDKYKNNVFLDVQDGWYKNTASNIRLGIHANRTLNKFNIYIDGGLSKTGTFNNYLFVPPIYALLGLNYQF